jgi:hypothetical protein
VPDRAQVLPLDRAAPPREAEPLRTLSSSNPQHDEPQRLAVKGCVLQVRISEPQPGVQVRVFAGDAAGETTLVVSETNGDGIYRVEFRTSLGQA